METRKKVDSLRREIVKMEESLARQEETQESREVVTAEFTRLKESFVKVDGQVKSMSKTVDYLGCMLDTRKNGFKHILRSTSKKINWNFTLQLSARNYVGKLDFNHKDKVLLIVVNPDSRASAAALDVQRDIRSLSGGEKSYSQLCLILSLWYFMATPFRCLDEWDVFLDSVNRAQIGAELTKFAAAQEGNYQFIFLSPQGAVEAPNNPGPEFKVFTLGEQAG